MTELLVDQVLMADGRYSVVTPAPEQEAHPVSRTDAEKVIAEMRRQRGTDFPGAVPVRGLQRLDPIKVELRQDGLAIL